MDDIIARGPWMGYELDITTHFINGAINPGLGFGCFPKMQIIGELLDNYSNLHFERNGMLNLKTILAYTTEVFIKNGLKIQGGVQDCCGFTIYPTDFFNPKVDTHGQIKVTKNTRSIHHFMASWGFRKTQMRIIVDFLKKNILVKILPNIIVQIILLRKKKDRETILNMMFRDYDKFI